MSIKNIYNFFQNNPTLQKKYNSIGLVLLEITIKTTISHFSIDKLIKVTFLVVVLYKNTNLYGFPSPFSIFIVMSQSP